jgi:mannose-6-phosphate isomerase-like protein (cupin superfamily)
MKASSLKPILRRQDEGEAWWFLGSLATVKASKAETSGNLSVLEFLNPPGFAPPLHRHIEEDEMFYILEGAAEFHCGGQILTAGPGDFVLLPVGVAHSFVVGSDEPLRALQFTTPGGFENFVKAVGAPASHRQLPDQGQVDPAALGHAAALHLIEILGSPPIVER